MSTKTSIKRIALVAVSALGFGLLSVAPSQATTATAVQLNFTNAGSTTAVAGDAAAAETIYVRSTSTANTFVFSAADSIAEASGDVIELTLSTSSTAAGITEANSVVITAVSDSANANITPTVGNAIGGAANDATLASFAYTANASSQTLSFSTGALAAGTYYIYWDNDATDVATGDGVLAATVQSYGVGAPVSAAYTVDGRTIVNASSPATSDYSLNLLDSAGRRTFLVGAEVVKHSWATVASGVQALDAISDTTAAIAPATSNGGVTFTSYTVSADTNGSGNSSPLTAGVTYTLTSVIQSGVNAFGSDSVTVRHLTSTNGLVGTLTFRNVTTLATVSSIALAVGDSISAGYQLVLRDSTGAVIEGVRPTVASSGGATTAQGGTTSSAGVTATGDWTYTAPNATSDTVTFTVTAGTAASITTSVAITIGASYATNEFDGAIAVSANGGRVASGTQSNTTRVDLSGGDAEYNHLVLNPADTTSVTVTYTLLNTAAPKLPVSGATLNFAVGAAVTSVGGATTLPTAARTLSATTATTGADGKATVTITIAGARDNEEFGVTVSSGGTQIGYADFLFTNSAVTIGTSSAGPAAVITQGAATATTVTLTSLNQYSQPVSGTRFQLLVTGPSAPATNPIVTTGADGTATYSVAGTTAVSGQTDVVTITHINGSSVTAASNDIVTINYVATVPTAASIREEYDLAQGTSWTNHAVTPIATAITTANAAANAGNMAGGAGSELIGTSSLPVDTNGDWTDSRTASMADGVSSAVRDETVALRFTVLTAAGTGIAGIPVTLSASTGAWIVGSLGTAVSSRTRFTDADGRITFTVFATKTGLATFTVTSGGATDTISWNYANVEEDARVVSVSSTTAKVSSGNLVPLTATVMDRYGNPVPGVTVTWSETGNGRFEGAATLTNASGVSTADFSAAEGETGSATVRASLGSSYEQRDDFAGYVDIVGATAQATSDYTTAALGLVSAPAGVSSASIAVTLEATTTAAEAAADAAVEAIDAANAATDAANLAAEAADAATVAAEEARDAADAATAAVEELATQVAALIATLRAQITTLANTVAKIAKKVRA